MPCVLQVNGVPVKAFVDSGAQMTIMTQTFATKCHLSRLMDSRFAGMAVGVGSSRILGKIHQAPLKVWAWFHLSSIPDSLGVHVDSLRHGGMLCCVPPMTLTPHPPSTLQGASMLSILDSLDLFVWFM
jgi:hypothetical protein